MKNIYLFFLIFILPLAGIGQTLSFSTQRGFFQNPFQLTLSTSIAGGTIRYTTDGSTPSVTNGIVYSVAVPINTTSVIRAIGFNGGTVTPVITHSYLFLDAVLQQPANIAGWPNHSYALGNGTATAVHDYEMDPDVVNNPAYSGIIKGGLTSIPAMSLVLNRDTFMTLYESELTFTASVEVLYPDNTSEQFNTGLESHSHDRLKRSLKLNIKSQITTNLFKKGLLNTAGAATTFKDTKIPLRAGNNRSWARNWNPDRTCYTRDEWYRSSQQAISGTGGRGTFVHLYVNGLYWGLYNPVERTDGGMLARNFGGEFADWMALDQDGIRSGDATRYNYLNNTLVNLDMAVPANYAQLKEYLDPEKFSEYLILTWMTGMTDWPENNYHGGNRNVPAQPFFFNAWDGEWSWDTSKGSNEGAWVHPAFRNNVTSTYSIPKLWHAVRRNPDFMQLFADKVYKHCFNSGALTDAASRARWAQINNYLNTAIIAESARWGDAIADGTTRTRDGHWRPEINRLDGLMNGNVNRFINALLAEGYYSTLTAPAFSSNGGAVSPNFQVTITNPNASGSIYYTTDGTDPRMQGGGVSPTALAYSGAVSINNQLTLKSRIFNGGNWSPLHEAPFTIANVITGLFINEFVASNTKFADEFGTIGGDWIEIYNSNNQPVDIGGLYFTDNLSNLTLAQIPATNPAITTIPAKGYIIVWADGFPALGPLHILPKLGKGGEAIGLSQLVGANAVNIDNLTFGAQLDDVSQGRFPDGSATMKQFFTPTPGGANIVTFKSGLFINEVLASNQTSITDETGEHDGWVEIYNNNSQPVDIGGMFLTDDLSVRNKYRIPTTQPALTTIPAKGFITLWADNQTAQGVLHLGFTLNASGGAVGLTDIIGPDVSLVDSILYQSQTIDVSTGRYPDGSSQLKSFNAPSPGTFNTIPGISNLFINEFMASNSLLADEFGTFEDWIEIYNANQSPVDVGGLFITDNLANLTKYQIPTTRPDLTTMPAGGFLRLWADEQPFQGVLHVGVKLSGGGEQIGLSQQNGNNINVIDSLSYTAQTTDISRGRQPNGSANFVFFTTSTPRASNNVVPVGQQVINFTLVNASTEQDIQTISNGATINLASLPTTNLNIRANTSPATVGRVVFALSGTVVRNITETGSPYALFGDINNGNYNIWLTPVGSYTLRATPFTAATGGTADTFLQISFNVVNQVVPLTLASLTPLTNQVKPSISSLSVYPNPVSGGRFTISNGKEISGEVIYILRDQMGSRLISGKMMISNPDFNISFDFSNYMQKIGVYYLQLNGENLKGVVKLLR